MTDGSRNVGEVYALRSAGRCRRALAVEYGGRYARYDYLRRGGLFSPRVGVTVEPFAANTRVSAVVAQRMVAPGAEEFVASETPGPWLPPERTFAPLGGPGRANAFSVERARYRRPAGSSTSSRTRTSSASAGSSRTSTTSW